MEKLYLDYNIINCLRLGTKKELNEKYERITDSITVFSPAHLEDIAVAEMRCNASKELISEKLDFLSKIAKRNSLRPTTRYKLSLYDESPQDCYQRVIDHYNQNDWAEEIESAVIVDAHSTPWGDSEKNNNIAPTEILNRLIYRELIALWLFKKGLIEKSTQVESLRWTFSDLANRFYLLEEYINLAANILEKIGYHREKVEKSRSRLHDVSHIIYAAYCDTFVSMDKKLIHKTKAIYSMLEVPTKVLNLEEFINS